MATWTNIANTSLEPGSPARSVDAFALRDNPIAIAEGAAGAPRIVNQAIQDRTIRGIKLMRIQDAPVVTVSAANPGLDASIGRTFVGGTTLTTSTSFVTAATITIDKYTGSLRFTFAHRGAFESFVDGQGNPFTASAKSQARILKNGTQIAIWESNFTSTVFTRTIDSTITPGDVFVLQHRRSAGDNVFVAITSNLAVFGNNPYQSISAIELAGNL
jgi:hypothetical protein